MAQKYGLTLLGQIPLIQSIREGADEGTPAALKENEEGIYYLQLAQKLLGEIEGK